MSVQAPVDPKHAAASTKQEPRVEVYWTAVTYKTVIGYSLLLVVVILGIIYLISPDLYSTMYHKASNAISTPDTENLSISQM